MTPWYTQQWKRNQQSGYHGAWGAASWKKQWPQGGGVWSCRDKNCIAACHGKPKQNAFKSNECEVCGVHWNQASQMEAEDLAAARKRLLSRQGQVRAAPVGATIAVTVEKEPDATWMATDDEAEALTTALSLPPDY